MGEHSVWRMVLSQVSELRGAAPGAWPDREAWTVEVVDRYSNRDRSGHSSRTKSELHVFIYHLPVSRLLLFHDRFLKGTLSALISSFKRLR